MTTCDHCLEVVAPGEEAAGVLPDAASIHYECLMRRVVGSVGHQLDRCTCRGGTDEDPPGLTPRQAARAAVALWQELQNAAQRQAARKDCLPC